MTPEQVIARAFTDELAKTAEEIPPASKWLRRMRRQADKRGYKLFAVAEDPNHPHGGGSVTSRGGARSGAVRHARKAHMEWEKAHGYDPSHQWKTKRAQAFTDELEKIALNEKLLGRVFGKELAKKGLTPREFLQRSQMGEQVGGGKLYRRVMKFRKKVKPVEGGKSFRGVRKKLKRNQDAATARRTLKDRWYTDEMRAADREAKRMGSVAKRFPGKGEQHTLAQRTEKELASGRHSKKAILPKKGGGVRDPKRVAYKTQLTGGQKPAGSFQGKEKTPGESPRWVGSDPKAARRGKKVYGKTARLSDVDVQAFDARKFPAKRSGPWTEHTQFDARGATPKQLKKAVKRGRKYHGRAKGGGDPFYEKVVTHKDLRPALTHRYKHLPSGRLQLVQGDIKTSPLHKKGKK